MALFNDILQAVSGAAGIGIGTQMLTQGGGGVTSQRSFTPGPSPAEQSSLQIARAIQLANLQQAGYDFAQGPGGELTLIPRATAQSQFEQQFGPQIQAGLQRELGGPSLSPLGGALNRQAMAGATGRPQFDREGLIKLIQQKQGVQPSQGLGLAPGPSPVTVGPVSSAANFSNFPASLGQQAGGSGSSFLSNLPLIAGGTTGALSLLKLLSPSSFSSLFGGTNTSPLTQNELGFAQFKDQQAAGDFDSFFFVPDDEFDATFGSSFDPSFVNSFGGFGDFSDQAFNFADQGFGIDINP